MHYLPTLIVATALVLPTTTQAMAHATATASAGQGASASASATTSGHCPMPQPDAFGRTTLLGCAPSWPAAPSTQTPTTTSNATATAGHGASATATATTDIQHNQRTKHVHPATPSAPIATPVSTPPSTPIVQVPSPTPPAVIAEALTQTQDPVASTQVVASERSAQRERLGLFLLALNTLLLIGILALQFRGPRIVSTQRF